MQGSLSAAVLMRPLRPVCGHAAVTLQKRSKAPCVLTPVMRGGVRVGDARLGTKRVVVSPLALAALMHMPPLSLHLVCFYFTDEGQ